MEALPVAPSIHVLDHHTYVHNAKRWVALAAVQTEYGTQLKFYKWKWNGERWRVDLARFLLADIDLCRLASDAIDLARKHGIKLRWPSLEQIAGVKVSIQRPPNCKKCGSGDQVRAYGTITVWQCKRCGDSWRA